MAKIEGARRFLPVNIAVLTVSDSRTLENDTSGRTLCERIEATGHRVAARRIVIDDQQRRVFRQVFGDLSFIFHKGSSVF